MRQKLPLDFGFADWLHRELYKRNMGTRTLARAIDPERVDTIRRQLQKYLSGEVWPEDEWREKIATALDVDPLALPRRREDT